MTSGFEENENSRFVDYTLASTFETLCFDIEQIFKSWRSDEFHSNAKAVIRHEHARYILSRIEENVNQDLVPLLDRQLLCLEEIKQCFNVNKFAILTTDGNWVNITKSSHTLLTSAMITALQKSGLHSFPVFVANVDISKIDISTRIIFGYGINLKMCNMQDVFSTIVYESHLISHIDSYHDLFYLDGVAKHFERKLTNFSHNYQNFSQLDALCNVFEEFKYNHRGICVSPAQAPCQIQNPMKITDSYNYLSKPYWEDLLLLWSSFSDYYPTTSVVNEIVVTIAFKGIKPGHFVDNNHFTTLQPSKQPPRHWRVLSNFKPLSQVAVKRNPIDGQLYSTSSTLASGLRRLISFYIYSRFCCVPGDTTMLNLLKLNRSPSNRIPNYTKAVNISGKLSHFTKLMVEEMCTKINRTTRVPNKDRYIASVLPTKNSSTYFSVLEMLSISIAGLSVDIQSVAELWFDFIEELRFYQQNDVYIPRPWQNKVISSKLCSIHADFTPFYVNSEESDEIYNPALRDLKQSLWIQMIGSVEKGLKENNGIYIELPNTNKSIIVQRLQFFNLCNLIQQTGKYFGYPIESSCSESVNLSIPNLLLRPPQLTEEINILPFMSNVDTNNPNLDEMFFASDIQAFKAENNNIHFDHFFSWYSSVNNFAALEHQVPHNQLDLPSAADREPIRKRLKYIWDNTPLEGLSIIEQNTLIDWNEEANKNVDKLSAMSPYTVSLELLISSLPAFYLMLHNEMNQKIELTNSSNHSYQNLLSSLQTNVNILTTKLNKKIHDIQDDFILQNRLLTSSSQNLASSLGGANLDNDDILFELDSIATQIEKIEEFLIRSHELSKLLPSTCQPSLYHKMAAADEVVLESQNDSSTILEFVKSFSHGKSSSYTWESIDGRELGLPSKKSFEIVCKSIVDAPAIGANLKNDDLWISHSVQHRLKAEVQNGNMMVSATFEEVDI